MYNCKTNLIFLVLGFITCSIVTAKNGVRRGPRINEDDDGMRDLDGGEKVKTKFPETQKWYDRTYVNGKLVINCFVSAEFLQTFFLFN